MVGIDRASVAIDLGARRCPRALVEEIVYAITVGIRESGRRQRTPFGIDLLARGCVGALIDAVQHTVAVLIVRAPARIDGRASRRVGALRSEEHTSELQ